MARGFLSGTLWGVAITGVCLGVWSVSNTQGARVPPEVMTDMAPGAGVDAEADQEMQVEAGSVAEPAPQRLEPAGEPEESAPDTLAALVEEARSPGDAPEVGAEPEAVTGQVAPEAVQPAPADETPVVRATPSELGVAPEADAVAEEPTLAVPPADVASTAPELADPSDPATSVAPPAALELPDVQTAPEIAANANLATSPAEEITTAPAPATADVAVTVPEVPAGTPEAGAVADLAETESPLPAPRPALPLVEGADAAPAPETASTSPQIALQLPRTTGDRPSIGRPAQSLTGTSTSALPRVGDEAGAAPDATTTAAPSRPRPVEAHAEPIELASDRPLVAIVLIDDGQGELGPEALDGFPYPVTVAVDPIGPDAEARALAYRALGLEVLALASLPDGASPQDVEVFLAATLGSVPQAVGVLEAPEGGLQSSQDAARQAVDVLSQTGHGLVVNAQGLNTAAALAGRAEVPVATVFRDFDGSGQTSRVMRRFLDQAAFKARQEGEIVMVGRMSPETVSALLVWGLQDRAAQVGLVPVSMVLR
ncbi:divergent polysaccharide deacetylase family protein [Pseudaestuariivita sp.]|uniref:divergent polysaccharide deacetylase family protein n=1 Tax=Pseudaestuariivita sp. TaxID=2211669 RepID=UPI004059D9DA